MGNFYDSWLTAWDRTVEERKRARKVIHEEELEWVETRNDFRAALLIAPETGFRTIGSLTMLTEIPAGCHSGMHKHGEEVIYVVAGEGFTVLNGRRYDWAEGSGLAVPFGAPHQHYNTGRTTARLFSAMAVHLEQFAGVHRTEQLDDKGETRDLPAVPRSDDGVDDTGRRIAISKADARPDAAFDEGGEGKPLAAAAKAPAFDAEHPLVIGNFENWAKFSSDTQLHRQTVPQSRRYMRVGKSMNGFTVHEMEISNIVADPPHQYSGKHAHNEALLYVLEGEGHTVVEGETIPWRKGTALHIQGPQTVHQHFVTGDDYSQMIRVGSGFRYFVERWAQAEFPYLYIQPRQAVVEAEKAK